MRGKHTKRIVFVLVLALMVVMLCTSTAWAAIAFQSQNTATIASGTTLTLTKPGSTALNDLLLAQITVNGGSNVTITPPSGWTLVSRVNNGTSVGQAVYWKVATASEGSSYTFTFNFGASSARAAGGILRYTGVDATNPIATSSGNNGSGTLLTATGVTAPANSRDVALFGAGNSVTLSTPAGMSSRYTATAGSSGPRNLAADAAAAGATGDVTSTPGATTPWVAHLVALNPRTLTVTATADGKTYDGTTTATAHLATTGILTGDTVTLSYTNAAFADKNAGVAKTVNVSGISIGGADAGEYILSNTTASTTATIAAKGLTISGAAAQNKTYDGLATAAVNFGGASLVGVVSGDAGNVTIDSSAYVASFANKNVGSPKAVSVSGVALAGSAAPNYTVSQPGSLTANITAKHITGLFTAADKTYNGTIAATVLTRSLWDTVLLDVVSLSGGSASFADKNVGAGKTVTLTGASLAGTDAGNYVLDSVSTTSAAITPRDLTVTASGNDKVYDGTTGATVTLASDKVAADAVTLSYGSAAFVDKNVGSAKSVAVSGIAVTGGADAGNYTLANTTAATTAAITAKGLTVGFSAADKTYDGTTVAAISAPAITAGIVDSEDVTVSLVGGAQGAFASKSVGIRAVSAAKAAFVLAGAGAANYGVGTVSAASATITARDLTVTASGNDKVYDATTAATVTLSSDKVASDALTLSYGSAAFNDKNVGGPKAVSVGGIGVAGADAGNYTLKNTTAAATAAITAKHVTGSFTAADKTWDGTPVASVLTRGLSGAIAGDSISLAGGTAAFADKNVGAHKIVTLTGASLAGADAGNYVLDSVATTTASITQPQPTGRTVLIVAPHPDDDVVYGSGVARAALDRGDSVKVVYMTNGDLNGIDVGLDREDEAVRAQTEAIGTSENDMMFLGYPDGYLSRLWNDYRDPDGALMTDNNQQSTTYGDRGLGGSDYHTYRFGTPAAYNAPSVVRDLDLIMAKYRPDAVYTTSEFDQHTDHTATFLFVRQALLDCMTADPTYHPELHKTIVWPTDSTIWPLPMDPTTDMVEPPGLAAMGLSWDQRESLVVPPSMQTTDLTANLKVQALGFTEGWLTRFVHRDEIFWKDNLSHPTATGPNIAALATVTASSQNVEGGQAARSAVDGVVGGYPTDSQHEWSSQAQKAGAWLTLSWPCPVSVNSIVLHDRPNLDDQITAATLTLSDGSTLTTGALPNDGSGLTLDLGGRTVTSLSLRVDAASDSTNNVGLSEIEVIGSVLPLVNQPPAAVAGAGHTAGTAPLAVDFSGAASTDPDGSIVAYAWNFGDGKSGSGAAVRHTYSSAGHYTATLTVIDNGGGTATTSLPISLPVTTHVIAASVPGGGGTISPSGAVSVNDGADQSFTITPDAQHHVADVIVDGESQGALTSYSFTGVTGNHTIAVSFAVDQAAFNAISVTAPTGTTPAKQGDALPVTWTTNAAVASGQFSLWVVSPANGWYAGKIVAANGSASYADAVDLNVPVDSGYRVFVYYRASSSDPWGIYGMSSGTVDVTTAAFNAISVTAPTGTTPAKQGDALPVTWTTNAAVASGQFSLWVVSPANGWYAGKIVAANGSASYADAVDLNVPVDSGYRVFVYYRASSSDPWGIYGMSSGTVDVTTAAFNAISVTAPTGTTPAKQGDALPVTWTTNAAVASGQFSLWVVSPANGWYAGKIVAANGSASYADAVDLNVPVDSGYRVFVYYRASSSDPWGIYGMSSGTVDVTAAAFNAISVTAPTGTTPAKQGDALPVTWTTNAAVASGQFSLWVVSPANGWYAGKIVAANGSASYADAVDLNVPVDSGYRVFVYYRASSSDPWGIYGMSSGTVDVTAAAFNAISVTAPTGTTPAKQGDALPVTWTTNAAVASGQFSLWVVSPANGWYAGKIVAANGSASYADAVDLNVPVDSGYRVFVYYRASSSDPWGIYGMSSGTVDVTTP